MVDLECRDLAVGYDGKKVVENVNFKIDSGDYLYIIGKNGSGKSTIMKTLLNLIKSISGSVIYGENVKPTEIGYIPQQTEYQKDFPASVYEIVLSGCLNGCGFRPFYTKEQKQTARKNMRLLGIEQLEKCCYRELSGGQQQRVLLARALCSAKKMLLLDEPVTGLDAVVTQELYELIQKLNREQKLTVIMISHDLVATNKYASHVLYVGKDCFFGTSEEFRNSAIGKQILSEAI